MYLLKERTSINGDTSKERLNKIISTAVMNEIFGRAIRKSQIFQFLRHIRSKTLNYYLSYKTPFILNMMPQIRVHIPAETDIKYTKSGFVGLEVFFFCSFYLDFLTFL